MENPRSLRLPETFINRVKNLYKSASTVIRINGFVSELFDIRRGVRQGDPMSCLLYNLAIEPLIESIRSCSLKGFRICNELEKVLVKVYTDDAAISLGPEDKPTEMQACLDLFCTASTARFNSLKTEIILIGTEDFRKELINSREYNEWKIDDEIHIAQEGEAVRILGSWQGDGINVQARRNGITERQARTMKLWSLLYPLVARRVPIVKALVILLAYYLMTVNGISRSTLTEMEKSIRSSIWSGRRDQMTWERAILPISKGGIGAPSVEL